MQNLIFLVMGLLFFSLKVNAIEIQNARIRAVPVGSSVSAAYMVINNPETKAKDLIKVETKLAKVTELHSMREVNGKMQMRPMKSLTIPARSQTKLQPGGMHLMLIDLIQPLKLGDKHSLLLIFSDNSKVSVEAVVTN